MRADGGPAWAVAVAAVFLWLGMVTAISFLEAPLKFRAPGVTLPVGLGIGRLVFRALNACEAVLSVVAAVGVFGAGCPRTVVAAFAVAAGALVIQVIGVRPALTRRSDAVLSGEPGAGRTRSRAHVAYVGLEAVKVVALAVTGVLLLAL